MKKLLFLIIFFTTFNTTLANTFIETTINGYRVKIIEYDINSTLYNIEFFKTNGNEEKSLKDILKENNAISGVNGIFFCPSDYGFCKNKKGTTNNDRYIKGINYPAYEESFNKATFSIDKNKNSFIYQKDEINSEKEGEIYYGLSNRPLLLNDGKSKIEDYRDKGLIDQKMIINTTRNFICNNKDKTKIYFGLVYDINMDMMPPILSDFGCYDALNLDGGLSTAFVYNGKYIVGPQRNIIDAVGIVPNFDLKKIDVIGEKIIEKIYESIKDKTTEKKIIDIEKYEKFMLNYKQKIYDKYSTDIINIDENGNKIKNGYITNITNIKALKLIYLINISLEKLKELKNNEYLLEKNLYN